MLSKDALRTYKRDLGDAYPLTRTIKDWLRKFFDASEDTIVLKSMYQQWKLPLQFLVNTPDRQVRFTVTDDALWMNCGVTGGRNTTRPVVLENRIVFSVEDAIQLLSNIHKEVP